MRVKRTVQYLGMATAAVTLILLLHLVITTLAAAVGISRVVERPVHLITLQIVNGTGVDGLEHRLARRLERYQDALLEIRVVAKARFDLRPITHTLIVARQRDKTAAVLLAKKLGFDPSLVEFRALENNCEQVSTTLILGEDYQALSLPESR